MTSAKKHLQLLVACAFFCKAKPVPLEVINILSYGAVGDGIADDTVPIAKALQKAAAAVAAASGSEEDNSVAVLFPANKTFLTGPLNISSHMTLYVEGTLKAISGSNTASGEEYILTQWPQIPPLPGYGTSEDGPILQFQSFIYGNNVTNVRITGKGTIDAQGDWWWNNERNRKLIPSGRPNLLQIVNCVNLTIDHVTLVDSPFWAVHPVQCDSVHIHRTTIRSRMYAPNSDGIDPDSCRNVMIEHNDVSVGDDHIAIKAGRCGDRSVPNDCRDPWFLGGRHYLTENVTVRNNIFRIGMGIAVGSETSGTIRNVNIYDNIVGLCDAGHCNGTCCGWSPALHLKTTPSRGGRVENIMFRNNTVYNTSSFIFLEVNYQTKEIVIPTDYPPTLVRNITFQDNLALGSGIGASFMCQKGCACQGIYVVNNTIVDHADQNPWRCDYIETYRVSGNSPPGLEKCMRESMNETASLAHAAVDGLFDLQFWKNES